MDTKRVVPFAKIFMSEVETKILIQSEFRPLVWKRYIDDIFSLWTINRIEIAQFIEQANNHHPSTAEVTEMEATFLDNDISKGERLKTKTQFLMRKHFTPTEKFQYIHFTSSHPPGVKKGSVKGEALRLLRTNSSKKIFEEKIKTFGRLFMERGYPKSIILTTLSEVKFTEREETSLPTNAEGTQMNLAFCRTISTIRAKP